MCIVPQIMGLNIAVHDSNKGGPQIACADIKAGTPPPPTEAYALIDSSTVRGLVTFSAAQGGGVDISYSFAYKDSSAAVTLDHKWHLHNNQPVNQEVCAGSTGGHYDPTSKEGVVNYTCVSNTPAECWNGDLSGKHGFASFDGSTRTATDSVLTMAEVLLQQPLLLSCRLDSPYATTTATCRSCESLHSRHLLI
jgi:hypothetical protein